MMMDLQRLSERRGRFELLFYFYFALVAAGNSSDRYPFSSYIDAFITNGRLFVRSSVHGITPYVAGDNPRTHSYMVQPLGFIDGAKTMKEIMWKKKCSSSSVVDCLWYHYATSAHPYHPIQSFSLAHHWSFGVRCTFENTNIQASLAKALHWA